MATPTFQPIQQPHTWMHNPDYNVKEFSPSFRFSTITELMETLALVVIEEQQRQNSDNSGVECSNQTRDDCWKRIEYVLSMCPAMPPPGSTNTAAAAAATNGSAKYDQKLNVNGHGDELDQLSEDDDFTEYTMTNRRDVFVLTEEAQEAVLAVGHFLRTSRGSFIDKLLPTLINVTSNLHRCKWHNKTRITPDFFAYNLISTIREISFVLPDDLFSTQKREIAQALVDHCITSLREIMTDHQEKFLYESKNTTRVLYGVFKALSEGIPQISKPQMDVVFQTAELFMQLNTSINHTAHQFKTFKSRLLKSMNLLIVKILTKIASSHQCERGSLTTLLKIATNNLSLDNFKRVLESDKISTSAIKLFIHSIDLAVACSTNINRVPIFEEEVFKTLVNLLSLVAKDKSKHEKEEEKIYIEAVKGIESICIANGIISSSAGAAAIREFCENAFGRSEALRTEAMSAVCNILQHDFQANSIDVTSQEIYAIASRIYTERSIEKNPIRIKLLGCIARSLDDVSVTELVLPVIMSQFSKKRSEGRIDVLMIKELASIAHLGHETSFKEVTDAIFSIYQNPLSNTQENVGALLSEAIYIMSNNIKDRSLKNNLLLRAIRLFNKLAGEGNARNLPQYIGILLPSIAALFRNAGIDIENTDTTLREEFRFMWFYCILFNFIDESNTDWPPEWFEACAKIATCAPLLRCMSSFSFLETEQQLNTLYAKAFCGVNALHDSLASLIPFPTATIKRFSFAQTVFLLSIYHLETLRVRSLSLKYFLCYLEDKSLFAVDSPDFFQALTSVINQVFSKWSIFVENMETSQIDGVVEAQMLQLLRTYCSRVEDVREACMRCISLIAKKFPQIYWNERCIRTMLDLVHLLFEGFDRGFINTSLMSITLPDTDTEVYLPETMAEREKMTNNLLDLTLNWIQGTLNTAPNVITVALQEYMLKFQQSLVGSLQHVGHSLAVLLSIPPKYTRLSSTRTVTGGLALLPDGITVAKDYRKGLAVLNEDRYFSVPQSVSIKSFHIGEITALSEMPKSGGRDFAIRHICSNLSSCLKRAGEGDDTFINDFNHYMQLGVALICQTEDQLLMNVLYWIVWTPVYIFTSDTMNTAIYCWRWLSTTRPDLEAALLTEMYHAWCWTKSQGIGLFSGSKNDVGPVELAVSADHAVGNASSFKDRQPRNRNHLPHRMWINFLSDSYTLSGKLYSDIFMKIILKGLENPTSLSHEADSIGTRFRLCYLGTLVARLSSDTEHVSLLRSRVYAACLEWFTQIPSWYDPGSMSMVEEDIFVLKELIRRLKWEKAQSKKYGAGSGNTSDPTLVISDTMSVTSRKTAFTRRDSSASINSYTTIATTKQLDHLSGTKSTALYSLSYESIGTIDLIVMLLVHELERIYIWTNPRSSGIPLQQLVAEKIAPRRMPSPKQWISHVHTAWAFHPLLAIKMASRFHNDIIREELKRLVRIHAADIVDIPEAVTWLVTPENVQNKIPQLKHLLHWAPSTLTTALTFLNTPYVKSPLVGQYAIRVLRRFSPDAIVFYLAQIVQCLRHDGRGSLRRFLLDLASKNVMFAHQLIWTVRTEVVNRDEMTEEEWREVQPAEIAISNIVKNLEAEVLQVFDERQLNLYREEFGFFDNITKISGDLVPVDKPLRSAKLHEMLKDVKVSKHLYTPTMVQCRIMGLSIEESATLKSAKKVPILIPFFVKQRDTRFDIGSKEDDDSEMEAEKRGDFKLSKVNLIFKMGDDCRQDQLTLQLISVFKRIFDRLHLPLYLYPYRVITTSRGSGIIEAVPNTMSRHQLGDRIEGTMYEYFIKRYGHPESVAFQRARKNFIESMAAYSVVSFILNIKDRHNGNILISQSGHVIHIDFGFIFDIAPGGGFSIEAYAPFKMTAEMLMLMGVNFDQKGNANPNNKNQPEPFQLFRDLVIRGFLASRDYIDEFVAIVEVMLQSSLPCFKKDTIKNFKARFCADRPEQEAVDFIQGKISTSYNNIFSNIYDLYQKKFEGIN